MIVKSSAVAGLFHFINITRLQICKAFLAFWKMELNCFQLITCLL